MRIGFCTALGATLIAAAVISPIASARGFGTHPSRPVASSRGLPICHVGAFCGRRSVGGGAFAGGPSDDYAVDEDEGFGTDDAFRFDKPTASGPGMDYRHSMPEPSDSYDSDLH